MIADSDTHFVVVRPKAIIDASASTWASKIVRLSMENPDVFENWSVQLRGEVS